MTTQNVVYKLQITLENRDIFFNPIKEVNPDDEFMNKFKWDKINRLDFPQNNPPYILILSKNKDVLYIFNTGMETLLDIFKNGLIAPGEFINKEGKLLNEKDGIPMSDKEMEPLLK